MQIAAEEGRLRETVNEVMDSSTNPSLKTESPQPSINYPVGKPLEVQIFLQFLYNLYDYHEVE